MTFFKIILKILTGLLYLLTVIAAYGGFINPAKLATPSILCLITPYLALLTVLVAIAWSVARNRIFSLCGVAAILLCIPSMSSFMPMGYAREHNPEKEKFTIISWNVLHTRDIRQPDYPGNRAVNYMINSKADIICLTELRSFSTKEMPHSSDVLVDSLFKAYPYQAGVPSSDIKVLSKFPVELMDLSAYDNRKGRIRFDFFKISFPENKILIVAMLHLFSYGLSDEERNVVTELKSLQGAEKSVKELKTSILGKMKEAFKKRSTDSALLREILDSIPSGLPLIVCGDFNDVPSSWAYNMIKGNDLRDAYTETNFGPAFTYNLHLFYFHIDQMLYRGPLKALDLNIGKIDTSDHYPLIGEFEFTD